MRMYTRRERAAAATNGKGDGAGGDETWRWRSRRWDGHGRRATSERDGGARSRKSSLCVSSRAPRMVPLLVHSSCHAHARPCFLLWKRKAEASSRSWEKKSHGCESPRIQRGKGSTDEGCRCRVTRARHPAHPMAATSVYHRPQALQPHHTAAHSGFIDFHVCSGASQCGCEVSPGTVVLKETRAVG